MITFVSQRRLPGTILKIRQLTHDGICVAEFDSTADDRRRSPRFNCGGRAKIYCLPFDGDAIFSGTLRNLSSGGICLALGPPFEPGSLLEVVVEVNSASFRAGAVVRAQRDPSATSLEFVQISARAKDVLEDVLVRLAKMQELNRRLRGSRIDATTERMLTKQGKHRVVKFGEENRLAAEADTVLAEEPEKAGKSEVVEARVIEIDLFG